MRLKLMQYNVQDLFLQLAYPVTPADLVGLTEAQWQLLGADDVVLKPLGKLRGLARVILSEAPDLVLLNEVGGQESLAHFARLFLDDTYAPLLIPGRARRGIGNGFLVRRGLPLRSEIRSHPGLRAPFRYLHEEEPADREAAAALQAALDLGDPASRTLSRDVAELALRAPGEAPPLLVLLLAHLKSPADPDRIDPGGAVRRAAEFRALLGLYDRRRRELGAPVIVAGDMNGNASRRDTAPAFHLLYETTDLEDVLELAGRPPHERITHLTFFLAEITARQLDYIFLPGAFHGRLLRELTYVHRYRSPEDEEEMQLPLSLRERALLPSDHYPVVCALDLDA